jgi:nucleotide-binding universal stress UspA family protein
MKDILVLATGGAEDERRLAYASKLSNAFGAGVDVVLANEIPPPSVVTTAMPLATPAATLDTDEAVRKSALQRGTEHEVALEKRLKGRQPAVSIVRVDETAGILGAAVTALARTRDTFVCSLPGRARDLELSGTIMDAVLVDGGRGVIGLPHDFDGAVAKRITIAWNGSREAVRAVAEAMPLLKQAEAVTVLLVDQERRAGDEARPGDDILRHLTRHGVEAKIARVAASDLKTSEAILAEAKRHGAELLVIGAQAEGGLLQWLRGSVSREVVSSANVPLFMAH